MTTIEPTTEMLNAYEIAAERALGAPTQGSLAGLAAVLAIVERDRCMQQRGHDRPREWPDGVGGKHPHHCASCSRDGKPGPGCINCRQTGYDQTPYPNCQECKP